MSCVRLRATGAGAGAVCALNWTPAGSPFSAVRVQIPSCHCGPLRHLSRQVETSGKMTAREISVKPDRETLQDQTVVHFHGMRPFGHKVGTP